MELDSLSAYLDVPHSIIEGGRIKIIFLYNEALFMLECALGTANCLIFTEQESLYSPCPSIQTEESFLVILEIGQVIYFVTKS